MVAAYIFHTKKLHLPMKVLFINSRSADYVQDLTYSGLVKLLGLKNVVDYRWNQKYHVPYMAIYREAFFQV